MKMIPWRVTGDLVLVADGTEALRRPGAELRLCSLHKRDDGRVRSVGGLFLDGKLLADAVAVSEDFWQPKRRGPKIARKAITYLLAHVLAMEDARGKTTLADRQAAKWLGVDEREIRRARNRKDPKTLTEGVIVIWPFDAPDAPVAVLIGRVPGLPFNGFEYQGDLAFWQPGMDVAEFGRGTLTLQTEGR